MINMIRVINMAGFSGRAAAHRIDAPSIVDVPRALLASWAAVKGVPDDIRFERGVADDYRALARFHYRQGPPATFELVLRAVDERAGELIGVLVVSRPILNGAWRALAWPGRFMGERRAQALALNREVRAISRLVVDPRWRGAGVGAALVRAYLAAPLTPCTEALAAMGRWCPVFERAGMRAIPLAPAARDVRLARRLRALGVSAADLVHPTRDPTSRPGVRRALEAWAAGARGTRGRGLSELRASAARAMTCRPLVFVAESGAPPVPPGAPPLVHVPPAGDATTHVDSETSAPEASGEIAAEDRAAQHRAPSRALAPHTAGCA